MKRFEVFNHTADIGVFVYGEDLKTLFKNAGEAFFNIITNLENVRVTIWKRIEFEKENLEFLMVDWLNELLFYYDVEGILFKEFRIEMVGEDGLKAMAGGEKFIEGVHMIKTQVKAVTYHQIEVQKKNSFWRARIIFDL